MFDFNDLFEVGVPTAREMKGLDLPTTDYARGTGAFSNHIVRDENGERRYGLSWICSAGDKSGYVQVASFRHGKANLREYPVDSHWMGVAPCVRNIDEKHKIGTTLLDGEEILTIDNQIPVYPQEEDSEELSKYLSEQVKIENNSALQLVGYFSHVDNVDVKSNRIKLQNDLCYLMADGTLHTQVFLPGHESRWYKTHAVNANLVTPKKVQFQKNMLASPFDTRQHYINETDNKLLIEGERVNIQHTLLSQTINIFWQDLCVSLSMIDQKKLAKSCINTNGLKNKTQNLGTEMN